VIRLALAPLRERGDDIELLAEAAMARTCAKYSGPAKQLGDDALAAMLAYRWPGNVRELNSKIEKAVLLCPTPVIPAAALEIGVAPEIFTDAPYGTGGMDLDEFQRAG
jgi:DNA-binding NtrC family response regulator